MPCVIGRRLEIPYQARHSFASWRGLRPVDTTVMTRLSANLILESLVARLAINIGEGRVSLQV